MARAWLAGTDALRDLNARAQKRAGEAMSAARLAILQGDGEHLGVVTNIRSGDRARMVPDPEGAMILPPDAMLWTTWIVQLADPARPARRRTAVHIELRADEIYGNDALREITIPDDYAQDMARLSKVRLDATTSKAGSYVAAIGSDG
jgi:hypothetical protein